MTREYDKNGLPVLPEGYFWSVRPNWATGSPYMHLRQEIDLYFFKFSVTVADQLIFGNNKHGMQSAAQEIMNRRGIYGDYR